MTKVQLILCAIATSAVAAACSSASTQEEVDASLKAATAVALPGADAQSIKVLNPQRSAATWRWNARVEDKVYACDADNQMRLPSCEVTT